MIDSLPKAPWEDDELDDSGLPKAPWESSQDQQVQQQPVQEESGFLRRYVADPAVSLAKGLVSANDITLGLADLATGGYAGKKLEEATGYNSGEVQKFLDTKYSPEQQRVNQGLADEKGFLNSLAYAVQNPSVIAHSALESLPSMYVGGKIGSAAVGVAPKAMGAIGSKVGKALGIGGDYATRLAAGAMGEGVTQTLSAAEGVRQESPDKLLSAKGYGLTAASGVLDSLIALGSGKVAQKLGIADPDFILAGGKTASPRLSSREIITKDGVKKVTEKEVGRFRRTLESAINEGLLEELPQTAQETILQNLATNKPWDENLGEDSAIGLLTGAATGAGFSVLDRSGKPEDKTKIDTKQIPYTPILGGSEQGDVPPAQPVNDKGQRLIGYDPAVKVESALDTFNVNDVTADDLISYLGDENNGSGFNQLGRPSTAEESAMVFNENPEINKGLESALTIADGINNGEINTPYIPEAEDKKGIPTNVTDRDITSLSLDDLKKVRPYFEKSGRSDLLGVIDNQIADKQNKIPNDLRLIFGIMNDEINQGSIEGRTDISDTDKPLVVGKVSTHQQWVKDINKAIAEHNKLSSNEDQLSGFGKNQFNSLYKNMVEGKPLTKKQQMVWDILSDKAKEYNGQHPDAVDATNEKYFSEQGLSYNRKQPIQVEDLQFGDKLLIEKDGVSETFEVKGIDDEGNVILKDGELRKIPAFEKVHDVVAVEFTDNPKEPEKYTSNKIKAMDIPDQSPQYSDDQVKKIVDKAYQGDVDAAAIVFDDEGVLLPYDNIIGNMLSDSELTNRLTSDVAKPDIKGLVQARRDALASEGKPLTTKQQEVNRIKNAAMIAVQDKKMNDANQEQRGVRDLTPVTQKVTQAMIDAEDAKMQKANQEDRGSRSIAPIAQPGSEVISNEEGKTEAETVLNNGEAVPVEGTKPVGNNNLIDISKDDIPFDIAENAHRGTSLSPDRRASSIQDDYVSYMQSIHDDIAGKILPENRDAASKELANFKDKYVRKYKAVLAAHSKIVSTMVAGGSNFNVGKNQKANDAYDSKLKAFTEWRDYSLNKMKSRLGIGGNESISSDDPDAVDKLNKKIQTAEKKQADYKAINKIANNSKLTDVEKVERLQSELGHSKTNAEALLRGIPGYVLSNNGSNIRRMKERVSELTKSRSETTSEKEFNGVRIVDNVEDNRVQLFFDGKPDQDVIKNLKSKGFKWSPKAGAWQRVRTPAANKIANDIAAAYGEKPDAKPDKPSATDQIKQAITKLESNGDFLHIAEIRSLLPNMKKTEFDSAMKELVKSGEFSWMNNGKPTASLSQEQKDSMIEFEDDARGMTNYRELVVRNEQYRPETKEKPNVKGLISSAIKNNPIKIIGDEERAISESDTLRTSVPKSKRMALEVELVSETSNPKNYFGGKVTSIGDGNVGEGVWDIERPYGKIRYHESDGTLEVIPEDITSNARAWKPKITSEETLLLQTISKDVVNNNLEGTVVNETIQNALDAFAKNQKGKEITINTGSQYLVDGTAVVYYEISDNGSGMTFKDLKSNLFKLGAKGKSGTDTRGGYGLAKAGFLLTPIRATIETTKNGVTNIVNGTKEQFFGLKGSGTAEHQTIEDSSLPNGTKFRLYFYRYESDASENNSLSASVYELERNIGSYLADGVFDKDLTITFNGESKHIKSISDLDQSRKPLNINIKGTEATVYFVKLGDGDPSIHKSYDGKYYAEIKSYTKGLRLFGLGKYAYRVEGTYSKPDFKILIDYGKTPPVNNLSYPFIHNRTGLITDVSEEVSKKINDALGGKDLELMNKNLKDFGDMIDKSPEINGIKILIPFKDSSEFDKAFDFLKENEDVVSGMSGIFRSFQNLLSKVYDKQLNLAVTVDPKVHGFRSNPKVTGHEFYAINPFAVTYKLLQSDFFKEITKNNSDANAEMASNLVHTLVHEFAHDFVQAHDENFTIALGEIYSNLTHSQLSRIEQQSRRFYESYGQRLLGIQESLQGMGEGGSFFSKDDSRVQSDRPNTGGKKAVRTDEGMGTARVGDGGKGTEQPGYSRENEKISNTLVKEQVDDEILNSIKKNDFAKNWKIEQLENGDYRVNVGRGKYFDLKLQDNITLSKGAVEQAYGKTADEMRDEQGNLLVVAGSYSHGEQAIRIRRDTHNNVIFDHEFYHFLEHAGLISESEKGILKDKIKQMVKEGKWETRNAKDIGGSEDRAQFIAESLDGRRNVTGLWKKIVQRIQDFLDWVNDVTGYRSAESIVRDVASGKVLKRDGKGDINKNNPDYQIVFHGTPHVWQPEPGFPHGRPRLDKIGSGEGGAVFGWGWYSAEVELVADKYVAVSSYKKELTDFGEKFLQNKLKEYSSYKESDLYFHEIEDFYYGGYYNKIWGSKFDDYAPTYVIGLLKNGSYDLRANNHKILGNYETFNIAEQEALKRTKDIIDEDYIKNRIFEIEGDKSGYYIEIPSGNKPSGLYKLDIPNEVIPNLLDWDKSFSEQTPFIRNAIKNNIKHLGFSEKDIAEVSGGELYEYIAEETGGIKEASLFLESIGIPGNKYFDRMSRVKGEGTYNYVIWDQSVLDKIALLERNGEKLDAIREAQTQGEQPSTAPITETKAFKDWFGDSKVVDENGKPLVVYHGTPFGKFSDYGRLYNERVKQKKELIERLPKEILNKDAERREELINEAVGLEEEISFLKNINKQKTIDANKMLDEKLSVEKRKENKRSYWDVEKEVWTDEFKKSFDDQKELESKLRNIEREIFAPEISDSKIKDIVNKEIRDSRLDYVGEDYVDESKFQNIFNTLASGSTDGGYFSAGSYFTDNKNYAEKYSKASEMAGFRTMPGKWIPYIYDVYLKIENPVIEGTDEADSIRAEASDRYSISNSGLPGHVMADMHFNGMRERKIALLMRDIAIERGYDGWIVKVDEGAEYVVYNPNQIKSASENNGAFSPNDDRIDYAFAKSSNPNEIRQAADTVGKDTRSKLEKEIDADRKVFQSSKNPSIFDKWLLSPMYKKSPQMQDAFKAATEWVDAKFRFFDNLIRNHDSNEVLNKAMKDLKSKFPDKYKRLQNYILKKDRTGDGYFVKEDKNSGVFKLIPPSDLALRGERKEEVFTEEAAARAKGREYEIEDYKNKHKDASDLEINSLRNFRKIADNTLSMRKQSLERYIGELEAQGKPIPDVVYRDDDGKEIKINLKRALAEMDDLWGTYFPRLRMQGGLQMKATRKNADGTTDRFMKFYDFAFLNDKGSYLKNLANKAIGLADKVGIETLPGMRAKLEKEGYTVSVREAERLPENIFLEVAGKQLAIEKMMDRVIQQIDENTPKTLKDIGIEGKWSKDKKDYIIQDYSVLKGITADVLHELGAEYRYRKKGNRGWGEYVFKDAKPDIEERIKVRLFKLNNISSNVSMELAAILTASMADLIRSHGARSGMLKRTEDYWEGFENDPAIAITRSAQSVAGGEAKRMLAQSLINIINGTSKSIDEFKQEHPDLKGDGLLDAYQDFVKESKVDPAKQSELWSDIKSYMDDLLRNEEKWDRVVGQFTGLAVAKYLAFRVSAPIANLTAMVTTVPASMNAHAGIDFAAIPKLLSKAGVQYTKYLARTNEYSSKLFKNPEDFKGIDKRYKAIFDEIVANGWDKAQYNYEAVSVLRNKLGQQWDRVMDWGMAMFGVTEQVNRATTIAATAIGIMEKKYGKGYDKLTAKEFEESFRESLKKAHETSNFANAVFGKADSMYAARGADPMSNILRSNLVFKRFGINYMMNLYKIGVEKKNLPAAAYMILSPMIVGGFGASMVSLIPTILSAMGVGSDDWEEDFYKFVDANFGNNAEHAARFGIPGLLGVSFKGSVDTLNGISPPKSLVELFGAPASVAKDVYEGISNISEGNVQKGIEGLLPNAFASISKAQREYTEGATKDSNTPIFFGNEPLKLDFHDAVMKALSFSPADMAEKKEILWNDSKIIKKYAEQKNDILDKFRKYYLNPIDKQDKEKLYELQLEVMEFNDKLMKRNINRGMVSPINAQSIRTSIRRAMRPSTRERFRGATLAQRAEEETD